METQIIEKCEKCNKIYCENIIKGECMGDITKLDYCVLCKADNPYQKELREQKIGDIFSKKIDYALYISSVRTIGGLIRKSEYDLLDMDGIGKKSVEDIKTYLHSVGLKLNKNK